MTMTKFLAMIAALGVAASAAAITITLPDPTVYVNLKSNITTVGISGEYRHATSEFVYVSECATPDTPPTLPPRYRCDIMEETLQLGNWTVHIVAQFAAKLQTSGHNQWVQTQTVLGDEIIIN